MENRNILAITHRSVECWSKTASLSRRYQVHLVVRNTESCLHGLGNILHSSPVHLFTDLVLISDGVDTGFANCKFGIEQAAVAL